MKCWSQLCVLFVGSVLGAVGCSNTPKVNENTQGERYVSQVSLSQVSVIQPGVCARDLNKVDELDWKNLVELANSCYRENRWSELDVVAQKLVARDVHSPWGSYYLSLLSEKQGDLNRALWMIELAIKKTPGVALFHFQQGRILWKMNEFSSAVVALETSLKRDDKLTDAHLFLGQIYHRDREFDKSCSHFEAVVSVRASDPIARSGLEQCGTSRSLASEKPKTGAKR